MTSFYISNDQTQSAFFYKQKQSSKPSIPFITTWTVVNTVNPVEFIINQNRYCNITINWGDGISETFNSTIELIQPSIVHTYTNAGVYTVTISGEIRFIKIHLSNSHNFHVNQMGNIYSTVYDPSIASTMFNDIPTLLSLNTYGLQYTDIDDIDKLCTGCVNLETVNTVGMKNIKYMSQSFAGCTSLTEFSTLYLTNVFDCQAAWLNCGFLVFNTTGLTSVRYCENSWGNCTSLTNFDAIGLINVLNCTNAWVGNSVYTPNNTFINYTKLEEDGPTNGFILGTNPPT